MFDSATKHHQGRFDSGGRSRRGWLDGVDQVLGEVPLAVTAVAGLLITVRLVGTSALGAQRWISVAGFHAQPSEFARLATMVLLAGILGFADLAAVDGWLAKTSLPWTWRATGVVLGLEGLFALPLHQPIQIASLIRNHLESLIVIGVAAMLMFQVIINTCMSIGLGPVTGIPKSRWSL